VGNAAPERLERAMRGRLRRGVVLRVIFGAMPRVVRRSALERERVAIEWRIGGRRDGGHDVRQLVIADGTAVVLQGEQREPELSLSMDGATLLLLATGNASGPTLFVTGEVAIDGDPWLAMRLPWIFGLG
jgi:predicted lipid carrier protein YhbT